MERVNWLKEKAFLYPCYLPHTTDKSKTVIKFNDNMLN
jgi:hypothetical protein